MARAESASHRCVCTHQTRPIWRAWSSIYLATPIREVPYSWPTLFSIQRVMMAFQTFIQVRQKSACVHPYSHSQHQISFSEFLDLSIDWYCVTAEMIGHRQYVTHLQLAEVLFSLVLFKWVWLSVIVGRVTLVQDDPVLEASRWWKETSLPRTNSLPHAAAEWFSFSPTV